jgi:hypothetical protein
MLANCAEKAELSTERKGNAGTSVYEGLLLPDDSAGIATQHGCT